MLVYSIAFICTAIFLYFAFVYYKKFYAKDTLIKELKHSHSLTIQTKMNENEITIFTQSLFSKKHRAWKYLSFLFVILSILPLVVIASFRDYSVGTDVLYTYVPNYNAMYNYGYSQYREPLFYLLLFICTKFSANPSLLLFASSLIYVYLLIKAIVKYSDNSILSIIIVFLGCFFFIFLNNIRQSIASIIMLYAFDSFSEKKFTKFFLFFILALGFHLSSVILFIPFILLKIKFFKKHYTIFTILLFLLLPLICKIFLNIVSKTTYSYYIESDFNNNNANIANIIFNTIIYLVSIFILRKKRKNNAVFALLVMQFFATYVSWSSLFIRIGELTSRITAYFTIFQILLIPKLYKSIKPSLFRTLFIIIMISAYFTYMFIYIVVRGYHNVLPYTLI